MEIIGSVCYTRKGVFNKAMKDKENVLKLFDENKYNKGLV